MWKLYYTLLYNQWSKEIFETTENETEHKNLIGCNKSSLKRDLIVINAYIKQTNLKITNKQPTSIPHGTREKRTN